MTLVIAWQVKVRSHQPRMRIHNISKHRHQASLDALKKAEALVAQSSTVDGVIVIIGSKNAGPRVITAGALDSLSQAVTALARTQLGLLTKPDRE